VAERADEVSCMLRNDLEHPRPGCIGMGRGTFDHMRPTSFYTLGLNGMLLVSLAVSSGCASNSDVAAVSEAHAPAAGPTPGSVRVYVNGSVAAYGAFGH
jgi:hypothetical protein